MGGRILKNKRIGLGSLSLILCIFSIIFSFIQVKGHNLLGETILGFLGLSISPVFVSLILFCISLFLGYRYKDDLFAKVGMKLSIFLCIYSVFVIILSWIYLNNVKIGLNYLYELNELF